MISEKQSFLEMKSTEERLQKSVKALKALVDRQKISAEIEEIIKGNGHLQR